MQMWYSWGEMVGSQSGVTLENTLGKGEENSVWLDLVPKRQSKDVGLHVHSGSGDFGVIPKRGRAPKSRAMQPSLTGDEVTLTR